MAADAVDKMQWGVLLVLLFSGFASAWSAAAVAQGGAQSQGAAQAPLLRAGVVDQFRPFRRDQVPFDAVQSRSGELVLLGRRGLLAVLSADRRSVARTLAVDDRVNFLAGAIDKDGVIHLTDSDGRIWGMTAGSSAPTPEAEPGAGALFAIQYLDDGSGIAVGEFGAVLVQPAGSQAWQKVELNWQSLLPEVAAQYGDVAPHLYRICEVPSGGVLVVGEYGTALERKNGQWLAARAGETSLFSCAATSDGRALVAGQSGQMWMQDAGVAGWARIESGLRDDVFDLAYYRGWVWALEKNKAVRGSIRDGRFIVQDIASVPSQWLVRVLAVEGDVLLLGDQGYGLMAGASSSLNDQSRQYAEATVSIKQSTR